MALIESPITTFRSATDKRAYPSTMEHLFDAVKNGKFAGKIRRIRHAVADGHDKDTVAGMKRDLPAIITSGQWTSGGPDAKCTHYTGIMCGDFDHLDLDAIEELREVCRSMPEVAGWFLSPSGAGLKVFAATMASSPGVHRGAWASMRDAFAKHGFHMDKQTSDPKRLCYVSHDEDAHWSEPARAFPVSLAPPEPERCALAVANATALDDARRALARMPDAIEGQGGDLATFRACLVGRDHGIPEDHWWPVLADWNREHAKPAWREHALRAKLAAAYRNGKSAMGASGMLAGLV